MPLERCNLDRKYGIKTISKLKSTTWYPGTPPVPPPLLGEMAQWHRFRGFRLQEDASGVPSMQWCQVLPLVTIMEMSQLKLQFCISSCSTIRWWLKCRLTRNSLHALLDQQLELECGEKERKNSGKCFENYSFFDAEAQNEILVFLLYYYIFFYKIVVVSCRV